MSNKISMLLVAITLGVATFTLAACDSNDGPAEKAGQKADNAADSVSDAASDAKDSASDAADDAKDKAKDATNSDN